MGIRRRKRKTGLSSQGPVIALPPDADRKTQRLMRQVLAAELAKLKEERPHTPFRFRHQLGYTAWLAAALAGLISHEARAYLAAALAAMLSVAVTVAATRHRPKFTRWHMQGQAGWSATWAVVLAIFGIGPWAALGLLGWAIPWAFWAHAHRWDGPAAPDPKAATPIEDTWRELAEAQKWSAWLGPPQTLPSGARWPVICKGSQTHIGTIIGKPDAVAAAYDSDIMRCWVEGREDGVRSRGWLNIMNESTLQATRPWDGIGIDLATGLAVVGRFPEGGDAHERFWQPGVGGGTKHRIVSGADGSGKTHNLDMGLCISALSGRIASVILDPQNGQALPAWQERLPYACGVEECMTYLRGLYAAMMARSEYLAGLRWKHPRTGRTRKGMGFFDYDIITAARALQGLDPLPIIEIVVDESPILLAVKGAAQLLLDIAKLGRKVGFRLVLAAQVPSMAELGKSELRSILVASNTFGYRSGDKVSGGMMNLEGAPHTLPKYFPDGSPTRGLCFADTIEGRSAVPCRTDYIEEDRLYDFAETTPVTTMDESASAALHNAITASAARIAGLAQAADDLAVSQLQVLSALTGPMPMGALIVGCDGLSASQVVEAAAELETAGKIRTENGMVEPV